MSVDSLGTLGTLFGIVVFLGAAVVYLRGSKDRGTIETLERNNSALNERVGILERDNAEFRARVDSLERENASLLAQRPSADVLAEITDRLTAFVEKSNAYQANTLVLLQTIAERGDTP